MSSSRTPQSRSRPLLTGDARPLNFLSARYETAFGTDITERVKRHFRAEGVRTAGELEWAAQTA